MPTRVRCCSWVGREAALQGMVGLGCCMDGLTGEPVGCHARWHWHRAAAPPSAPSCPSRRCRRTRLQMSMQVVEAAPTMKGETAAPSYKRAVVEGGIEVRPPEQGPALCCSVAALLLRCVAAALLCCAARQRAALSTCRLPSTTCGAGAGTPPPCNPLPSPPLRWSCADPGAAVCAGGRLSGG